MSVSIIRVDAMVPLILTCLVWASAAAPLLPALKLKPLVSSPVELLNCAVKDTVPVEGQQALTVVFSRPVIALGADFGKEDTYGGKIPFSLSCSKLPGRFRWVTTNIARFDPETSWPTDLDCTFSFNSNLTSFDGVPLELESCASTAKRLTTAPLTMQLTTVISEAASNVTESVWSPTTGMPDDELPEVPKDARIILGFNNPVNLEMLQAALELRPKVPGMEVKVNRCASPPPPNFISAHSARSIQSSMQDPATLNQDDTCVEVTLSKPLEVATAYQLLLPAGSSYNALCGPVAKDTGLQLAGLRSFRLPIRADFQMLKGSNEQAWDAVSSPYLLGWLPHGLSADTSVDQFAAQLRICELLNPFSKPPGVCKSLKVASVTVRDKKGLVTIHVPDIMPQRKYLLRVLPSDAILDGFGLPLQESKGAFWTQSARPFFQGPAFFPGFVAVLTPSALPALGWPYLARGQLPDTTCSASVWHIDEQTDLATLVQIMSSQRVQNGLVDQLGAPASVVQSPGEVGSEDVTMMHLALDTRKKAHIVSYGCSQTPGGYRQRSASLQLLLQADIAASIILSPNSREIIAWVTDTSAVAGEPVVQGATVHIFLTRYQVPPRLAGTCVTNADGWCRVALEGTGASGYELGRPVAVVVGPQGDLLYLQKVGWLGQDIVKPYQATLVLDRLMVRPGDTLHVQALVQKHDAKGKLEMPSRQAATLRVSPSWDQTSNEPVYVDSELSAEHGTLHTRIAVPPTATPGTYSIQLLLDKPVKSSTSAAGNEDGFVEHIESTADGATGVEEILQVRRALRQARPLSDKPTRGWTSALAARDLDGGAVYPTSRPRNLLGLRQGMMSVAFATITVADPRPPTADLTLEAPTWAKPDAPVQCKLRAVSYLGSQVAQASMRVTWNAGTAQGSLDVVTDDEGLGSFIVPLQGIPSGKAPATGDTLFVTVEWIGPTRERIVRNSETRLDAYSVRLNVGRSLDTDLPGIYFSPLVEVFNNKDNLAMKGVPVSVTLAPVLQNSPPEGSTPADCRRVQECSIGSGEWLPQCRMVLPCLGWYELKACATDGLNANACSLLKVGRNASEWAEEPLKAFDVPQLRANASRFELGTVAGFAFENPWGGSVFVVWGNKVQPLKTRLISKVEPGHSQISIPAGAECMGGCTVMVLLASPQASDSCPECCRNLKNVPEISRLFDCRSPILHSMQTRLEVVQERSISVTLSIGKGTDSEDARWARRADAAVAAPGEDVSLCAEVQMGNEAIQDAEVTFIAVDKAVLDLLPLPLQNLASAFQLDLAPRLSHATSEISRVHPGAVETVFRTLVHRLGLIPWLPLDTTVTPSSRGLSPVDEADEAFLSRQASAVTYMPRYDRCFGRFCQPLLMEAAFSAAGEAEEFMTMDAAAEPKATGAAGNENARTTAGGRGEGGTSNSPRMASNFVATPLFHVVRTTTNGTGTATFTIPSKLGTYVIRAYAVAKAGGQEAKYGQAERELVVRRKLSLSASLPRIVRMGDTFLAGVIVTAVNEGDNRDFDAIVSCEVMPPASGSNSSIMLSSDKDAKFQIKLTPEQPQQEVRFAFAAVALGTDMIRFHVEDADGASDTLLVPLPCLAPQQPVHIATSFAVRPGFNRTGDAAQTQQSPSEVQQSGAQGGSASQAAQTHTEGLQLPSAVPGSGVLHLVAGVGHLPSIVSSYESIAQSVAGQSYPRGRTSLVLATMPLVMRQYQQQLSPSQSANASTAAASLALLTHERFGLLEFPPDDGLWNERPEGADVLLNAWASWVTCKALSPAERKLGSNADAKPVIGLDLVSKWRTALAQQLVLDAEASRKPRFLRKPEPYSDFYTLAWARLAMGAHWHLPLCDSGQQDAAARMPIGDTGGEGQDMGACAAQQPSNLGVCASSPLIQDDLSLATLVANASIQGMGVQLLVALLLEEAQQQGPPLAPEQAAFVLQTADTLVSQIRVTARTAYVSLQRGSQHAAGFDVQALALRLLTHLSRPNEAALVQKLAAYVARQDISKRSSRDTPVLNAPSPWAVALMVHAMAAYDIVAGSSLPDLRLLAAVDQTSVLEVSFSPNNFDLAQVTVPWAQLPSNPGQLSFQAEGHGEATIAASLHFVPATLLRHPTYRGLWVESAVRAVDPATGNPVGPPLEGVKLGAMLAFTLQLTTPDDLGPVTIDVLMPAGLEPVDPNLSGGGARGCALGDVGNAAWKAVRSWWPICPTQETRPEAVQYHYQSMMAGTHTLEFMAVSVTEGLFILPSAKAFADNQAEVMGMTASRQFEVCAHGCSPQTANAQE
uniref:Alpha-2-macroglobulin domain-containing protein n=1 Tax=Dunaliella tertiolecta TaxID=3047 RepID=A0A7S3VJT0_DUNTE|mmetsp:Transcript_26873/g.72582  ORF Transcript_26873/g.72582 Transcript_26873/m.72582 type:complete len:2281 (-) Transcript_26873:1395-8237(-)